MGWSKVFLAGVFAFYATFASAAGDLAPDQARKARSEIWSQYKLVLPFLSQVLEEVPVKRASSDYLTSFGSSLGIYCCSRPNNRGLSSISRDGDLGIF
jgi:hypothetical protein